MFRAWTPSNFVFFSDCLTDWMTDWLTDWLLALSLSRLLDWLTYWLIDWLIQVNMWKYHVFELRRKKRRHDWSSQLYTQLKQLWNDSLKTIQAWTGFEPMTSSDTGAVLYQLSYQVTGIWSLCESVIYL